MLKESAMARLSQRKTCIKNLEERDAKLKKLYLASLIEDDALKPDNCLMILCLIACRKLKNVSSKRYLFRSRKYHKNKGECPYDKDFLTQMTYPG